MKVIKILVASALLLPFGWVQANAAAMDAEQTQCLHRAVKQADDALTLSEIRRRCAADTGDFPMLSATSTESETQQAQTTSELPERRSMELSAAKNPYGISPHRVNYLLPISYSRKPNAAPFGAQGKAFDRAEAKFQISYKVPIVTQFMGQDIDAFFAYTNQSFWQAYNADISRPFRETNHEPELFLTWTDLWVPQWAEHVQYNLGLSHHSNGRSGSLSRSWNRLYAGALVEKGNLFVGLKLWDRIPDDPKDSPDDPRGDDNPDIEKFMGHFELDLAYVRGQQSFGVLLRNNLRRGNNRGAFQLDYSFPLTGSFQGYVQYFDGYGESLIDYNHDNQRLGIGIAITEWP